MFGKAFLEALTFAAIIGSPVILYIAICLLRGIADDIIKRGQNTRNAENEKSRQKHGWTDPSRDRRRHGRSEPVTHRAS